MSAHVWYRKRHIRLPSEQQMNALHLQRAAFMSGCAESPNTIQSFVQGMSSMCFVHMLLSFSMH